MHGAKRVISILQPGYLPYIGFFELMARCDAFVLYDDVQYDKHSWRNRNRILGPNGPLWLTVPVLVKGKAGQLINAVHIDNRSDWRRKHLASLRQCYSKARYFSDHIGFFEELYRSEWSALVDLDKAIIKHFRGILNITCEVVRSSHLRSTGSKTERIISVCREMGADAYISTNGARVYLEEELFSDAGVVLIYQDYHHPIYEQVQPGFQSHMSAVDLLFNHGPRFSEIMLSRTGCPFNSSGHYRGLPADALPRNVRDT